MRCLIEKWCAKCGKIVSLNHNHDRHGPNSKRHPYHWSKVRLVKLAQQPCCEDCEAAGITKVATEVHHKIKPNGDPTLLYSLFNLMSLCKSCHSVRTQKGE